MTLAIARRLKERIDREPGMRAVLTRDSDYFVEHRERIARARRQQADMFVSVHADSYRDRSVVGSSVYVLSARGASDESARWLADRENAADLVGGVSLDDKDSVLASVLLDLSQGASMSASVDAAQKVMDELDRIGNVTRRGVKHAGFLVLKSPDIPSILVETAFISNPTEEKRLGEPTSPAAPRGGDPPGRAHLLLRESAARHAHRPSCARSRATRLSSRSASGTGAIAAPAV